MVIERKDTNFHDEQHSACEKLDKIQKLINEVKEHLTNMCVCHYCEDKEKQK